MSITQDIKDRSVFWLANDADCLTPDDAESAGAEFLASVRDAMVTAIEDGRFTDGDDQDVIHEIADDAPSIYTYTLWRQFVDLGAYQEDPESGQWPDDLGQAAMVALYQIAERLCCSLLASWRETQEPLDGDDPDDE